MQQDWIKELGEEQPTLLLPRAVGHQLMQHARAGAPPTVITVLPVGWSTYWCVALGRSASPREALALVLTHLNHLGLHSPQSLERLAIDMSLFAARLEVVGVPDLNEVTEAVVRDFLEEAVPDGPLGWKDPALDTQHFRRTAVRLLFKAGRALGLCSVDPTLDIELPARDPTVAYRPLRDAEVLAAEAASRHTLSSTRLPAAWALAEATAITSEIAVAETGDVDLANGRVWLRGCSRREPRWGSLTTWGIHALDRRLCELRDRNQTGLVYRGTGTSKSAQSASCGAVHEVFVLAGLDREPGVRPLSVAAWAGRRLFDRTGRIEDAANAMGLRSLDRAAFAIAWDWR